MEKYIIVGIVLVAAILLHFIITKVLTKKYTYKLMKLITQDEQTFLNELDSLVVKYLFPVFNREFFRLNYYIINTNDNKVKEQLSLMENINMNHKQKLSLYQTVFKYFVSINKKSDARNILRKISAFVDENNLDKDIKTAYEMEIKIYLDKDIKAIPYIDAQLEDCTDQEKAVKYLEKAYIYKANNQMTNAIDCMNKVIEFTEDPRQKETFKQLIDNNLEDL